MFKRILALTVILVLLAMCCLVGCSRDTIGVNNLPQPNKDVDFLYFPDMKSLVDRSEIIVIAKVEDIKVDLDYSYGYIISDDEKNKQDVKGAYLLANVKCITVIKHGDIELSTDEFVEAKQDVMERAQREAGLLQKGKTYLLFLGTGGYVMHPDLATIELIQDAKNGGFSSYVLSPNSFLDELANFKSGDELIEKVKLLANN